MGSAKSSKFRKAIIAVSVAAGISLGAAELLVPTVAVHEGEVQTTYQDVVGINTVCYGDTDPAMAIPGATYSSAECLDSLARQIIAHAKPMLACVPGVTASDDMTAAFGSLSFNIGVDAFCRSTVARRFNSGDYAGACEAITWWNKAGGKVWNGLVKRRADERAMCERGIPAMLRAKGEKL